MKCLLKESCWLLSPSAILLLHVQVQAYEIPQIAAAVAELSDTDQIPITYMVVRKRHNTRYDWLIHGLEISSTIHCVTLQNNLLLGERILHGMLDNMVRPCARLFPADPRAGDRNGNVLPGLQCPSALRPYYSTVRHDPLGRAL